ncbi:MAG: Minf_1886 family protein [Chthoniobacterales bacterium]
MLPLIVAGLPQGTPAMQKIGFAEALDSIVTSDPRYQREAYIFLRDALDYTTKQQKKSKGASVRHVSGPELLEGVRKYALKEFGPMVVTVLSFWGIKKTEDVGHMVFNLIGAGIFGKTEEDSIEDFKNIFDFNEAFAKPFAPEKAAPDAPPIALPAPKVT